MIATERGLREKVAGRLPALFNGFLKKMPRLDCTFAPPRRGKSAQIVVTIGIPAPLYHWGFGAHELKSWSGAYSP